MRIGYGTVIAAGTVYRRDLPQGDGPLFAGPTPQGEQPVYPDFYPGIKRITVNNINYIANIIALRAWYREVRSALFGTDPMMRALYEGALEKIATAVTERIERLKTVAEKMPQWIEICKKVMKKNALPSQLQLRREFFEQWSQIEECLNGCLNKTGNTGKRDEFLHLVQQGIDEKDKDYTSVIKELGTYGSTLGTEWLQGIGAEINSETLKCIPCFQAKRL